jgi:hypothetical protein
MPHPERRKKVRRAVFQFVSKNPIAVPQKIASFRYLDPAILPERNWTGETRIPRLLFDKLTGSRDTG